MQDASPFHRAIALIDQANSQDPRLDTDGGQQHPKELLYSQRMTQWVETLDPNASEVLLLAARAQHIRRWEIPRDQFPMNRPGYHQWRTTLYKFHADTTAAILQQAGYPPETIAKVELLLQKKNLKTDPDTQTLENAAALVFLEHEFTPFSQRPDMDTAKLVTILQKTWRKMSPNAQQHALKLPLPPGQASLIQQALRPPP